MPKLVILDTDIGTDVDDCLALSLILGSPELQLAGVTCVYGDVQLRGRMVLKLLQLAGRDRIPVFSGASKPLLGLKPVYWEGHEGQGLLQADGDRLRPEPEHAVAYLVRSVLANPNQIHLLAIGPLTNIALAFLQEPRLPHMLASLTIMGGVLGGVDRLDLPYAEHNILSDPEAAHIVLSAGAPLTLVPLDVTTLVRINQNGLARIRAAGDPFHAAVADQLDRYPRFARNGVTYLHDPLAAALLVAPDLVTCEDVHVDVETGGRFAAGVTFMRQPSSLAPVNAHVALRVDAARATEFIAGRIAGQGIDRS